MILRKALAAGALMVLLGSGPSFAATYSATSAVGSGADHSLWISGGIGGGIGSDFNFSPAGIFDINPLGVGTLTGLVESQSLAGTGFSVAFNYDLSAAPFTPSFKSENGSAAGPDIRYTYLTGGTLTGTGELDGVVLSVDAKPVSGPYAVQFGSALPNTIGPNNKNQNRGLAHWLMISTVDINSCVTNFCANNSGALDNLLGRQGDINIDLALDPNQNIPEVPLPATLPLFLGGLGLLGILNRRRKRAET